MTNPKCKHNNDQTRCKICFEEIFGKADEKGRRKGFNVIGQKTGGSW